MIVCYQYSVISANKKFNSFTVFAKDIDDLLNNKISIGYGTIVKAVCAWKIKNKKNVID